jgi:ribose 5-phosphate isomerase B
MQSTRREFVVAAGMVAGGVALSRAQPGVVAETGKEQKMMKIVVAADPFAVGLKDAIVAHLKGKGYEVSDVGSTAATAVPYYDGAVAACKIMQAGVAERALLFCGTGMGMSIVANRFKGVTASVVESVFAAKMCRAVNNANALCLGQMIWGEWMAKEAVDVFLKTSFTEGLDAFAGFLKEAVQKVDAIRPN